MRLVRKLIFGLLFVVGFGLGGRAEEKEWVEQAVSSWNRGLMEEAVDALDARAKLFPNDVKVVYWQSVASFHLLLMADKRSDELIDPVLKTVKRAYRLDENHSEINAMLCVLYGMKIKEKHLRSVWLGPRLMSHSKKALASPENPRALYLVATCRYYSGQEKKDFEEALGLLTRAQALFEDESRTPTDKEPRWGPAGCAKFIKMTKEKLKGYTT